MGISEQTFYTWKRKYAGLGSSALRELRQLREENGRLKRLVADQSLSRHMLREISCERDSKESLDTGANDHARTISSRLTPYSLTGRVKAKSSQLLGGAG